jgi:hypothetical protein
VLTAAVSIHHSGLLLLFVSSFQHVSFLCRPNQPQCLYLILSHWGQSLALCLPFPQRLQSNLNAVTVAITSSSLSLSLNLAQSFSISFHAKTIGPICSVCILVHNELNSSGFFLSHGIASFAGKMSLNPPLSAQIAVAFVNQSAKFFLSLLNLGICFNIVESMVQCFLLSCFFLCLLSSGSTFTKLAEVNHRLLYFEVCWKPSKLATS